MISVEPMRLGTLTLPDWHPRADDGTCLVQGFAVRHPEGVILYDTGAASDHPLINDLYDPTIVSLIDALHEVGIDERDVVAIVNSHLHFDHCGQNRALPNVPVWVQRVEYELIETPMFTVPEWAHVEPTRRRSIDGDADLVDGVRIIAAPGHTPGHQALMITNGDRSTLLGGQCCYTCAEFDANTPAPEDAHGDEWRSTARASIARLHELRPDVLHLSHDTNVIRRTP